jgi:hypothetical protein
VNFYLTIILAGLAMVVSQSFGQHPEELQRRSVNLPGTLELVDKPSAATPVGALEVVIHSLHGGVQFRAQPNRDGTFTLENVRLGRYCLDLGFPGRIRSFTSGSKSLMPDDFQLVAGEDGPLRVVVSLKTSDVSVEIAGIPDNHKDIVALLSPADPYLTLRESSFLNRVSGSHTRFRFITPGRYMLFIVDSEFQMVIASSAAGRKALKDKGTSVQVADDGETQIAANYVSPDAVKQAITEAGLNK